MPTRTQAKEANAKFETQLVTVKAKKSKCSTYFKYSRIFLCFSLIKSLYSISAKR